MIYQGLKENLIFLDLSLVTFAHQINLSIVPTKMYLFYFFYFFFFLSLLLQVRLSFTHNSASPQSRCGNPGLRSPCAPNGLGRLHSASGTPFHQFILLIQANSFTRTTILTRLHALATFFQSDRRLKWIETRRCMPLRHTTTDRYVVTTKKERKMKEKK